VLESLFGAFMGDVRLMPEEYCAAAIQAEASAGPSGRARIVADYIAGMTDRYALGEYQRLFGKSAE